MSENNEAPASAMLNAVLEAITPAKPREDADLLPVILVGLGGTGAEVLRRIKANSQTLGTGAWIRYLVVDTDETSKPGKNGLPSFEDNEYCYLPQSQARIPFDEPAKHRELLERLELTNPRTSHYAKVKNAIVTKGVPGAGAIRAAGLLRLACSLRLLREPFTKAYSALSEKWENAARARNLPEGADSIHVILVGSICGGTGSGMLVDAACALREWCTQDNLRMSAFLTMPEVYYFKITGADERARIQANAYATLRELDYYQNQAGGGSRRNLLNDVPVPTQALFNDVYLVDRWDVSGKDLASEDAVYDHIALHLAAEVGLTAAGQFQSVAANDACKQGLAEDPDTGRTRSYSTLSVGALSVPVKPLLTYCALRQAYDCVRQAVVGPETDVNAIKTVVDTWLAANFLEERKAYNGDMLIDRLLQEAPSVQTIIGRLYQEQTEREVVYRKDRKFIPLFRQLIQNWDSTDLTAGKNRMTEAGEAIAEEKKNSLSAELPHLFEAGGLRRALSFLTLLQQALSDAAAELKQEAAEEVAVASQARAEAEEQVKLIDNFIGRFGTDYRAQQGAATLLQEAFRVELRVEAKKLANVILAKLSKQCGKEITELQKRLNSWQKVQGRLETAVVERTLRPKGRTGETLAELNALTPDLVEQFYTTQAMTPAECIAALKTEIRQPDVLAWLEDREENTDPAIPLVKAAGVHFSKRLPQIGIEKVLDSKGPDAYRLLQEVLCSCRPLWRAHLPWTEGTFGDTVIVVHPQFANPSTTEAVKKAAKDVEGRLKFNPQYRAELEFGASNDPYRIYAMRKTHGGLPMYLANLPKYQAAYARWQAKAQHLVHVFPAVEVADMPALEPSVTGEADKAFALAMAYGLVALRGKWHYKNLEVEKVGQQTQYTLPVDSQWDGLLFHNNEPRPVTEMGAVTALVKDGRLKLTSQMEGKSKLRLGQDGGRAAALAAIREDQQFTRQVLDFHNALLEAAGTAAVIQDLEGYVQYLGKTGEKSILPQQVQDEIKLVKQEINDLREAK